MTEHDRFRAARDLLLARRTDLDAARAAFAWPALERFNWLEANKASIASQAAAEGIRAVATKFGATVEFAKDVAETNPQFLRFGIRMGTGLPTLNNDPKAIAAIIDATTGVRIARQSSQGAPGGPLILKVPQERLGLQLAPAPDPRLVEKGRHGPLPRIGADGSRP